MGSSFALALALLVAAVGIAAGTGPNDFPPGCGVLTVVQDGATCGTIAQASNQTLQQLLDRNPDLNCSSLAAGDTVCTADLLGYCGNKVATSAGQTCTAVAAASGLTFTQLLGLNPQLTASGCGDLSGTDVCLPSLPADASCGGVTHAVASGDTCDSIGQTYGMSCAQVQALNPKAFTANGTAIQGLTLCIGCPPQPTCGIDVSPALSSVLNADLQLCAVFQTCSGDFTLDSTSGLSTLDLSIPQPDGEAPSTIRITPGAFADGGAMVQLADVAPQLLSVDLFGLLGGLLGETSSGSSGVSANIAGLKINLLNGKPLLGATQTGFLGLFGRRRLQAARRQSRRLLGNNWRPSIVRPSGYMHYPRLTYY